MDNLDNDLKGIAFSGLKTGFYSGLTLVLMHCLYECRDVPSDTLGYVKQYSACIAVMYSGMRAAVEGMNFGVGSMNAIVSIVRGEYD
ncbi:hypothetical protein GF351_02220 [Candidatus Woesearchaeota archaeon]|nr:hypothetical protein [Candidatus Woesearchaeota archaeon]